MKRIIVDFLRRWWRGYLLAVLFVGGMAAKGLKASFIFVGIFMLPFAFELGRRPFGVMTTLPVSRRTIALSYWRLAVLLPVLLMTGSVALVGLFFHSSGISLKDVAMILFGSLAFAGSAFCLFTFVPQDKGFGEHGGDSLVFYFGTLWFCSFMFSKVTTHSPVVYIAGLIGLLLTVLGYVRSEILVTGRARKRPGGGQYLVRTRERISSPRPVMARFGGVFFDVVQAGFLFGLLYSGSLLVLKLPICDDTFVLAYMFAFGGIASFRLLRGGMRLLRTLPLSTGQLALRLSLMPLFGVLPSIAGLAIIQWIKLGQSPIHDLATLVIPCAGTVCIACSFIVPFHKAGNIIAMLLAPSASAVIVKTVSNVKWPAAFWWLLGLCLMAGAFFLNRHWLRSSYSYRPSTGDFSRRQR